MQADSTPRRRVGRPWKGIVPQQAEPCSDCAGAGLTQTGDFGYCCQRAYRRAWYRANKAAGRITDSQTSRSPAGPLQLRDGWTSANVGAVAELIVCADLLSRGWEAFRAVSSTCSVDVIAHRHGHLIRIQVKTARKTGRGTLFIQSRMSKDKNHDMYALVWGTEIRYVPPLPD